MAAGGEHFGGLQRDLVAAMEGYSDEELAVVRRFLADMTDVIVRHSRRMIVCARRRDDGPDATTSG